MSAEDVLLIVGDLNARLGSGRIGGDRWDGVHGRHAEYSRVQNEVPIATRLSPDFTLKKSLTF